MYVCVCVCVGGGGGGGGGFQLQVFNWYQGCFECLIALSEKGLLCK